MKRFIATVSLAFVAAAAFAADRPGLFQRSPLAPPALAGLRDPLDPVTFPPSSDASLSDLGVTRTTVESYRAPRPSLAPRPYWENDPLFTAPPP